MKRKGILIVVSGFSGAGKGTLMKELLKRYDNYALSISATTRSPREGEADGREYFFISQERFQQMIEEDRLIEYAQYVNHYYGTPKDYVMQQMAQVYTVDMREELKSGNRSILSGKLAGLMADRLENGEQTMLFLNRRGYSGFISCITGSAGGWFKAYS